MGELGVLAATPQEALRIVRPYGADSVRRVRAGDAWFGLAPDRAVYLAATPAGVAGLRLESTRRTWAAALGIAMPLCLHEEPGLVVTERVPADPLTDPLSVAAAVDVVGRLARAGDWPEGGLGGSRPRRLRQPWTVPVRLLRGARRGVPWPEFRALRAEAARLPADVLAHGDFQDDNLLWDRGSGQLRVVDWEYLGLHPAGTDLLNLWVQMPEEEVRPAVLEAVLQSATDRRAVGVLAHWLALRHLAEVATGHPGDDGAAAWRGRLANARRSLARAREFRATLRASA